MPFFDASKSIVENLYLISGPVIAIFGFFIFRQIQLAKEQLKIARDQLSEAKKQLAINSTRDSIKLAAEQVKFYMDTIVSYSNESNDKLDELKIKRIIIKTTRFIKDDIFNSPNFQEKINYLNSPEIIVLDLKTMNSLETFSTFFIQRVADEKVAFQAVGKSFVALWII